MKNKNFEPYKSLYKRIAGLLILAAQALIFINIWFGELNLLKEKSFDGKGNILIIFLYIVIQFILIYVFGGFKIGYHKGLNVILSQVIASIVGDVLFWIQVILIVGNIYHLSEITFAILRLCLSDIVCCVILSNILIFVYNRLFPPYRMLLINGYHSNELRKKISSRKDKYQIREEISISRNMEEIQQKAALFDAVILNDIPSKEKNEILKFCFNHSIRVYFTPKISDIIVKGANEVDLFDSPLFLCKNIGLTFEQRVVKRIMDLVLSVVGLVLTSPLLLIAAIGIKLQDRGPIFFMQERCSLNGKVFTIYKLRSMIVNAEKDGKSRPAVDDDDRITTIGHFIRKTRIDELPQLVNVLKGDMSIIGPRPERIEHVEKYTEEIPEFSYRMKVKGGLTGYAQVYGKYNTSAYDKLKMDLKYIANYSLLLDIQILLMTVKVIFMKESTEGFQKEVGNNLDKVEKENGL